MRTSVADASDRRATAAASGLDRSGHRPIGHAGGGFTGGGRVIDAGRQPFNRLGCTILNVMGQPSEGLGDLASCGSFQGLV
jgi:hypothetical protein